MIPTYGIIGAAIATALAYLATAILTFQGIREVKRWDIDLKQLAAPIGLLVLCSIPGLAVDGLNAPNQLLIAMTVNGLTIFAFTVIAWFKLFGQEERDAIKRVLPNRLARYIPG